MGVNMLSHESPYINAPVPILIIYSEISSHRIFSITEILSAIRRFQVVEDLMWCSQKKLMLFRGV